MKRAAFLALLATATTSAVAADAPIRIWGPPAMRAIAERWADAYRQADPDARFELTMRGSDTAVPGLYGGRADIALMGRPNDLVDDAGFSRPLGYKITRIEIANGSRSVPGKSDAIAILVSATNPLAQITLKQLAAIVDCGKAGPPIRTWGELGLTGGWAKRPIHIHAYDFASRTGTFFQHVVSHDGRKMCWDRIAEYKDARTPEGTLLRAADRIGDAARDDRDALAISNPAQAHDGLKLVAIADADAVPVLPDEAAIVTRRYPLARRAYAFLNRKPDAPHDARVTAFLAWVLSPRGQALLAEDRGYLPLDPATARAQRAILEERR